MASQAIPDSTTASFTTGFDESENSESSLVNGESSNYQNVTDENIDVTGSNGEDAIDAQPFYQQIISWSSRILCWKRARAAVRANDGLYNMNHLNRGKCIIFNHEKFMDNIHSARVGTQHDVDIIAQTFTRLGFEVNTYNDLKFDGIMKVLSEESKANHSDDDCFCVFALTHGTDSNVWAYDLEYNISYLWNKFTADKCPTLATKPKLFFIQACRGSLYDEGTKVVYQRGGGRTQVDSGSGTDDERYKIPNHSDFLTVFSSFEGHYSFRNEIKGSYFIQNLCKVFITYYHEKDVLSMLTIVNRKVAICFESSAKGSKADKKKQTPHVCHTLTRDLYF